MSVMENMEQRSESGGIGRVLVIIPTYNERENLPWIVPAVLSAAPVEVLVADDNSPDGTGDIADELAAGDERIHVLHRAGKEGLGAAYLAGFAWALERGYDVVVEMDADGSHRPADLPLLLAAIPRADLVLGSRWVPGGTVVNWPKSREILSRGGNTYARLMLKVPLADATGGFRAFRADTLRAIDLHQVGSQGYVFQVDMANRVLQKGMRVVEVPITFVEREHGTSKMSRKIVGEAMWQVTRWGAAMRKEAFAAKRGR
jgi:dolichol-phosphate mannosyltransferase